MGCCTPICKKWTTFSLSLVFISLGLLIVLVWSALCRSIIQRELSLSNRETKGYTNWRETPIPMYIEFYLWNLTNSHAFEKGWNDDVVPIFEECGPYTYNEHHIREAVVFNDNDTVTYNTTRIWKFLPEKSRGSLEDVISTVNPIILTVATKVKNLNILVQRMLNFFINEKSEKFISRQTVKEFIFDGYKDPLLDLLKSLNLTSINIPFDKFGWFVNRNESVSFDGITNMYSGANDMHKLGRINTWNYESRVPFYDGACADVNGTSGELWYPTRDDQSISIFATDICSTIELSYEEPMELHGITGRKYVGTEKLFDNGTKYPEMGCFLTKGVPLNSGVRNISSCKFDAPVFISYPHYYLADSSYSDGIVGMHPSKKLHEFSVGLEPNTGLPLRVSAALQINLKAERVAGIKYLSKMKKPVFIPALWFRQTAVLSESLASQAKVLLVLPSVGHYTGFGVIAFGALLLFLAGLITVRKGWKGIHEEERLINQQAF